MTDTSDTLDILYQDQHLIAIDKPAGLLVHRSPIDRHETRFVIQTLRDQIGQRVYAVHRLDKPTSGVLVLALDSDTQQQLSRQFETRQTGKIYQAICRGYTDDEGEIDYPLPVMQDFRDRAVSDNRQEAVTTYRTLARVELPYPCGRYDSSRYSLLALYPKTGRKHQLRRHMKHIFHPIVGDTTHGDNKHNRLFRAQFANRRLLLRATELHLQHPVSGAALSLRVRRHDDFERLATQLFGAGATALDAGYGSTQPQC
ncbi:pseudouridine synthase [Granulosicoccaceae sp. 1_MG-2023]|nr:pseudouridine synthase [Granulosicoccaceae sp. 1_MG-2023]